MWWSSDWSECYTYCTIKGCLLYSISHTSFSLFADLWNSLWSSQKYLVSVVFLLKVNEFPDFLSGEERECCQHVLIQHLTESVKVKVQVSLFRRVYVWSLPMQINVSTARKRSCGKVMFSQVSVSSPEESRCITCGRYASYWNAVLLFMWFCKKNSIFLFTILE